MDVSGNYVCKMKIHANEVQRRKRVRKYIRKSNTEGRLFITKTHIMSLLFLTDEPVIYCMILKIIKDNVQ